MSAEQARVLCTGDLHLGRHPTRIPEELDGPECSPRSIWQDIVQEAIDRDVDVVVLTGDIADRENRYFEAYGAFEDGVALLNDVGIPVVTVAGNHDATFLPRMVDDIDRENLHLLGRNGKWERWELEKEGDTAVCFDGWSFPHHHVSESPLDEYDLDETPDTPQIGVLHTELDSPGSQYAPVESSELQRTAATGWLLGHIHTPGVQLDSDPVALYPGSPQGLDPGERGVHGPWIVTIDPDGTVATEQIPMASVCYDEVSVDVSDAEDLEAVGASVSTELQHHIDDKLDTRAVETFLPRVRLTGRTPAHTEIVDGQNRLEDRLARKHDSIDIRIESVRVDTRPAVDLEELADSEGPVSYLADLLLSLQDTAPDEEYDPLITNAQQRMRDAYHSRAYDPLRSEMEIDQPGRDEAIATVEQEARVLLDTLLQQKEGQS